MGNTSFVFSQKNTELGGGIGVFNYTGDLTRKYQFRTQRPGATVNYKFNMNKALNFRTSITGGYIYGSDSKPTDAFATQRAKTFRVFAFEVATAFEYNFLDMKGNNPLILGTPYIFGGFGIAGFSGQQNGTNGYSPIQPVVPIGIGAKYVLNPHWYISLEFGARILFFDYLDEISYGDPRFKNYQYGNWYDNDRYYFLGFSATYSFFKIPCPRNPY